MGSFKRLLISIRRQNITNFHVCHHAYKCNIGLEWISPLPYCHPCIQLRFNSHFKWRLVLASLHKRSGKKESVGFIYALSGPQLRRVFFVNNSVCVQRSLDFSREVITLSTSFDNSRALPSLSFENFHSHTFLSAAVAAVSRFPVLALTFVISFFLSIRLSRKLYPASNWLFSLDFSYIMYFKTSFKPATPFSRVFFLR